AVLKYSFEGNLENEFVVQNNPVRKWYHAPWLHWGPNGREFVRGLTKERPSKPFELSAVQDQTYDNFAVGFYNAQGATVIGKIWRDPAHPEFSNVVFPEDTVSFKLLFTTTPENKVPFLAGSPEWVADVERTSDPERLKNTKVRLLQIDVAVR